MPTVLISLGTNNFILKMLSWKDVRPFLPPAGLERCRYQTLLSGGKKRLIFETALGKIQQ
jgi:hypothetical protein